MKRCNSNTLAYSCLLILTAFLLVSCTAERKLAKDFYKNRHNTAVLMIPADFVYKRNLKAYELADEGWMEDAKLDSMLFSRSLFMQFVPDSIFLETYMNSLLQGLRNKGLNVYLQPDTDLFLDSPNEKFIVSIAQLMLEESVELVFDPEYDIEYDYLGDFYLNSVILSSWFEISGVNEVDPKQVVAFAEMTLTDQFEGRLRLFPFTGNMSYVYSVDSIQIDDIYYMAYAAGQRYSGYLFDYLMNRYITRNIPPDEPRTVYYRYDFNNRMMKQAMDEKFIIIE